ncbi:ABC transporter substrate-binding protein [Nesterenkonia ebinurensis]|uniref:ABC transporter substrate-binding protein n=1 Tax=Nesterenkonia ebinurensis TaxID=2608252 RepID=UPI00123D3B2A|nr:extracellular solute-binding protein [Nesterenkonia ebinurensis]
MKNATHTAAPLNKRRRLYTSTAMLAIGALVLSACGGDDDEEEVDTEELLEEVGSGAMEDFEAGDTFVATEDVTFTQLYRDHPNYPIQNDWRFLTYLEEEHNVTVDTSNAPLSDWEDRRSLVIGAGDMPDFIPIFDPGDETQFVAGGSLLAVSDYLDLMPNLTQKIEDWELQGDFDGLYQADGKFYILPGIQEEPFYEYGIAVRWDIWEELGYDEPETWDEFADQLRGVQEAYPDMHPYSDRWEFNATLNQAAASFDTVGGWGFGDGMQYDADADEFVYAPTTDGFRDMVGYFAELVDEGLLDGETLTQDDDLAIQKFASGQSAAIFANDQEILNYRDSIEEVGEEDWEVRLLSIPAGPAGNVVAGGRLWGGLVVNSNVVDEDYFVALMQFLDWLYYSDEGLEYAKWGIEGETFERDGDQRVLDENIDINNLNPGADESLNTDYGFHNGVWMLVHGSSVDLMNSMARDEVIEFRESMFEKEIQPVDPPRPLDDLELERASITQNALNETTNTRVAEFIAGNRSMDQWDEFLAELENSGLDEYVELHNEAYQRAQEELDGIEEDIED